jgi:hypothetical protein
MWYSRNGRLVLYALIFCALPDPNAEMTVHTEVEPGQIAAVEARGAVCDELVEEPGNSSSKGLCPT